MGEDENPMICELCGREVPKLKMVDVEGSILKVCFDCAKFGKDSVPKPVEPSVDEKGEAIHRRLEMREKRMGGRDIFSEFSEELVEDYHKRIARARNDKGWTQEDLGRKLNERKSIIAKLENKTIKPDNKLIRKLEKTLEIVLLERVEM